MRWFHGIAAGFVMAAGVGAWLALRAPDAEAFSGEVFEITGGGSIVHFDSQPAPGRGPSFKNKVTAASLVDCIKGTEPSCAGLLDADAGGKAYIFFDTLTRWRVGTSLNGTNATQLEGYVDGKGTFLFMGRHAKSGSNVLISGKVKFQKGTYTPLSIKGKIIATSSLSPHQGAGTFKSVGGAQSMKR